MKNALLILFVVFALSIGYSHVSATSENDKQREAVEQIWALEEAYIAYHRDANHKKILPIWHDQFLGWPDDMPQPANKKEVARYTEQKFIYPGSWTFEIERAGIRVLGNVAINHYIMHYSLMPGGEKTESVRMTHTWIREGSQWRILGGMSNNQ